MSMTRVKFLIVAICLAMLASACGADDFSDTEASDEEIEQRTEDAVDSASDGAGEIVTEAEAPAADAAEEPVDEAMEEEAMSDDEGGPSPTTAVAQQRSGESAEDSDQASGGLFGESTTTTVDPDAEGENTFQDYGVRPFVSTDRDPLSTFALDVDTASYSIGRQWLESGALPPPESVRVEEYVNSFDYDYLAPTEGLNVQADAGPSPYNSDHVIVRLGVQAEQVANADRPDASLTFVVDTSGSMDRANRLALVKTSLIRLTRELGAADSVAIVTYSDSGQIVLPPTSVEQRDVIIDAIESLQPSGSTNLEAGLRTGYDLASEAFQNGGINRVVLASDGVANVGLTDPDGLAAMIRDDADRGIQLVTVGVGMGSFNDVVMEQLADQGDGFYAYVNDEQEAEKLFSDDLVSTLLTVAIDGKIQVEFNPDVVEEYRLIGFENRAVLDQDFRNDAVDAGELGAGHQVTALYELKLVDGIGGLASNGNDQLGTAQLRWEDPEERSVRETRLVLTSNIIEDRWSDTEDDFRLAVTVAAYAELLRESPHTGDVSLTQVAEEAESLSSGSGSIAELAELIRQADRY